MNEAETEKTGERIVPHSPSLREPKPPWRDLLRRMLEERFGLDVSFAASCARVEEELERIVLERGESWADTYVAEIARAPLDAAVVQALVALATNKESYFFRDAPAMSTLRDEILARAIERARPHRHLRVWSAGCSTGEELYSVAILVHELLGAEAAAWRLSFIGSDVDARALHAAAAAEYGPWSFRATPPDVLDRYFESVVGTKRMRVRDRYRSGVSLRLHNLAEDGGTVPQPCEFDVVLCRNVTIYFTHAARERLARVLFGALATDGSWIGGPSDPIPDAAGRVRIWPGLIELGRDPISPPITVERATLVPGRRATPPAQPAVSLKRDTAARPLPTPRTTLRAGAVERDVATDEVEVAAATLSADRGEVDQARDALTSLIDRGTVAHRAYFLRAVLYESSGEHVRAVEHYRRALYLAPRDPETHARLGLLLSRIGDTAEAIRSLRNALALQRDAEGGDVDERLTAAAANQLARLLQGELR
jgi:chemotaxis protein methyltransferase CheR